MSGRQLGLRPAWAVGSAGAIGKLPVLDGVECLTVFGEPDEANAKAIRECGKRWRDAKRIVLVNRAVGGGDLNDALQRRAAS